MKKLFREYKSMLKPLPIEGIPDLFIFRPIAFIIVKIASRFPVTPNQISLAALVTGISSGVCFALGTPKSWLWGGILYGSTAVLDCSDGMLARYKKNGTPIGRIIDGTIDYINGLAIYLGLAIGLTKIGIMSPANAWLLVALAGLSMAVHSILVDHYRGQFFIHALGVRQSLQDEIALFTEELKQTQRMSLGWIFTKIYISYNRIQEKFSLYHTSHDPEKYYRINAIMLKLWQFIELSMHICVLIVSAVLFRPRVFLIYTIVIANLWIVVLFPIQIFVNKHTSIPKK